MGEYKLTKDDYEKLTAVDKINEIIKNMSCLDPEVAANALKEADELTKQLNAAQETYENGGCKTVINKTVINKLPSSSGTSSNENGPQYMSIEAFKAQVSADAEERSRLRAERRAKAEHFKSQANEFFKVGDWENAITRYTKAINACQDWFVLYTNRAQACLRAGKPEQALADCDIALRLLPMEPRTTPTDLGEDADAARSENQQAAKACLHRGKALVTLRRPRDALRAYSDARAFRAFAVNPATAVLPDPKSDQWPLFLREYVAQAQTAIAAESLDQEAFSYISTDAKSTLLKPTEEKFLRLIAETAVGGRELCEYTRTLRKMAVLLSSAADTSTTIPPSNVEFDPNTSKVSPRKDLPSSSAGDGKPAKGGPTTNGSRRQRKRAKANGAAIGANRVQPLSAIPCPTVDGDGEPKLATLATLQSYFRIRNGFKVLESLVKRLEDPDVLKQFRFPAVVKNASSASAPPADDLMDVLEHLLAIITVCHHLARDCGENQRLFVETMPNLFANLLIDCLHCSPSNAQLPNSPNKDGTLLELRFRHLLSLLQSSACQFVALMSSEASGREGLLTNPGPAPLLAALSSCLSEALGLSQRAPNTSTNMPAMTSGCFAVQTSAATAKILENLTASPRFLLLVRSSDCFTSLQNVVEAAVAPASSSGGNSTSAPVACLSLLLDSLSSASDDPTLRRTMVAKPNFLLNLANCAIRHVPLITNESHMDLVSSLCRLLHNFLTGERMKPLTRGEMEALLNLTGNILDQPSRSSALLSVTIALLGKVLPLSFTDLVEKWTQSGRDGSGNPPKKKNANNAKLRERINILLSIISSYSASVLHEKPENNTNANTASPPEDSPASTASPDKKQESSESLASHRLRGAIRALAAITKAPGNGQVREAIGDSRLLTRRLAQLVRVRVPMSGAESANATLRDEPLAANVCLIFEACVEDDTIMAELLVGSSIILDLLKLIQESKLPETKRNAAVVIGRLATASHVHREEVSRLGGLSVLSRFNSWTTQTGPTAAGGMKLLF